MRGSTCLNSRNQLLEAARIKALDFAKANHMPNLKAINMKNYNLDDEKTFEKMATALLAKFVRIRPFLRTLFFYVYFVVLF